MSARPLDSSRWLEAQRYERGFWHRLGDQIEGGTRDQLDWYQWRANRLDTILADAGARFTKDSRVLEIGSGPIGIVNYLSWGERYAVDPLEGFYRTQPALIALRRPGVTYVPGAGEQLPFPDASFALVIIDNVIDHTSRPGDVLRQIRRVLRPDGLLYLSVNVHTRWGALLHTGLAKLHIDRGHPHTFTSAGLRRLLDAHQFAVRMERVEDYARATRADRTSQQMSDRIKGYTGMSEFSHCVICG